MAAGPFQSYDTGYSEIVDGTISWENDDITAVLLDGDYTPDRAAHTTYNDISGSEIEDADYAQVQIAGKAVDVNGTNIRVTHSAISFGSDVTISAKHLAYVAGEAGSLASGGRVIGVVDLNVGGGTLDSTNSDYSFTPHANGLFYITRSAAPA